MPLGGQGRLSNTLCRYVIRLPRPISAGVPSKGRGSSFCDPYPSPALCRNSVARFAGFGFVHFVPTACAVGYDLARASCIVCSTFASCFKVVTQSLTPGADSQCRR